MASEKTFCNSPWFELHIFWDGSFAYCCQQSNHIYDKSKANYYNIKNMSIVDWFNSKPMKQERLIFNTEVKNNKCESCWYQEKNSGTSRRHKSNAKSVIFQKENFTDSYAQSPHFDHFKYSFNNQGLSKTLPVDLHVDLGNHCNLACKMCSSRASSKIAAQELKWGILDDRSKLGTNWTNDEETWKRFLNEVLSLPHLMNVHFMGGETLLSPRFREFVERLDQENRHEVCFSFVTNGTVFDEELIKKLQKFKRVGIEISIETLDSHNEYIRQGTDNIKLLKNIEQFVKYTNNNNITLSIRPAIGLLSIGYYDTLIEYSIENKLIIKSLPILHPEYLQCSVLPKKIRKQYKSKYINLINKYNLNDTITNLDFNESNWHNYKQVALTEINKALYEINADDHPRQKELQKELVFNCRQWDSVYNFNMREYYPEFSEILDEYGY